MPDVRLLIREIESLRDARHRLRVATRKAEREALAARAPFWRVWWEMVW